LVREQTPRGSSGRWGAQLDVPRRTGPPMQQNSRQDELIGSMAHARPFGRPHSASSLQQTSNRLTAYTPPTVARAAALPRSAARFCGTEQAASSICWEAARPSLAMQVADESRWPWTGRTSRPPQHCEQLHWQAAAVPYDMPYAPKAPHAPAANDRTRPSSQSSYGYARGGAMGQGGRAHQIRPSSGFLAGGSPGPWPR